MDIIGFFKTIFLNFYYFDIWTAVTKHPIQCAGNVKIEHIGRRDSVVINDTSHIGIGTKGSFALGDGMPTYWNIGPKGKVTIKGTANICRGSQVIADGELEFGNRFYCNSNCIINSGKKITFDEDCLLGWNVSVMDGDGHEMGGAPLYEPITIGKHVWIASETMILKGSHISDGSVIAAHAIVTKKFYEPGLLIGNCNSILRKNISWKR